MTEEVKQAPAPKPVQQPTAADVLDQLKRKADLLGIGYASDITIDVLRDKIRAAQAPEVQKAPTQSQQEWETQIRKELHDDCMRLIRVRIVNLNPSKSDLPGEIWTVSNKYLGTVRRYIPYGEKTDNGWHVEKVLLDLMKERTFAQVKTRTGAKGELIPEQRMVKEFAIEELEPLSQEELRILANQQAAADGKAA